MELPQVIVYADIGEVRMETRASECTKLPKEGWVLLGVYPLTTLGDMTEGSRTSEGGAKGNKQQSCSAGQQEGQRYVRRLVGYVLGRRRQEGVGPASGRCGHCTGPKL
jgi:hypothetical protein